MNDNYIENNNHSKDFKLKSDHLDWLRKEYDVVIVGAGSAGVGVGILLQKLEINYVILEKDSVGSSFRKWPKETRFISPSFTGNFFKMPDLNAITPDTSPAFELLTEHPTGNEFADHWIGHFLTIERNHIIMQPIVHRWFIVST